MIPEKQTSYDAAGNIIVEEIQVHDATDAWQLAHKVYQKEKEAYCLASNRFGNGAFCVRVMTKHKIIFKIQSLSYEQQYN
ncbi:MAG: hypothetical protein ACTHKV_13905 [Flavipsychrobacter sp.]